MLPGLTEALWLLSHSILVLSQVSLTLYLICFISWEAPKTKLFLF